MMDTSAAFFAAFAKLNAGRTVALAGGDDDLRETGGPRMEAWRDVSRDKG